MGNILIAIVFFILYFFLEQYFLKRSLLKAGYKYSKRIKQNETSNIADTINFRKKTDYYELDQDNMIFKSINTEKPDLRVNDLDYKELFRFKKLIEDFKNIKLGSYEFFAHKKSKHLLYPYISDNNSIKVVLLQTENNTINDIFDRNPRK